MFSSTHKLQRQVLQPRTTSMGIFFRRRMPVNSTRACGNVRFTCSMHSLYWAFSAATAAFMSFHPTCITTVRTSSRGERLDRQAVIPLTVAPGKVRTCVPPLRSSLRLSTFLRLESPIRRVCTASCGRRRGRISFSRGESFLCCFCDDGGHSCSDGDGSCAEAESDSFA